MLRIKEATAESGRWLRLVLTDGSVIEREVTEVLVGPVFARIRTDADTFRTVSAAGGTVVWPAGADLDPDVLIWGGPPGEENGRPPERLTLRHPVLR